MAMRNPVSRLLGKLRSDTSGLALVELAIVAPFLGVMTLGTVDYSMLVLANLTVQGAARAGADYAAANGYNSQTISSRITSSATRATILSAITATPAPSQWYGCPNATTGVATATSSTVTCTSTGKTAGTYVTSSAQATYTYILAFPGAARTQTLNSSISVRIN
jgi:Flp pilus assembly protein TadG